jgi:hypothetical protein
VRTSIGEELGVLSSCDHTRTDKGIQRALSAVGKRHDILVGEVVMVGYAMPKVTTEGSKKGGSKQEHKRSDFPLDGAVGRVSRIVLMLFWLL